MITFEQMAATGRWLSSLSRYTDRADLIVRVTSVAGGQAEVRITPEGVVTSTTTGQRVHVDQGGEHE